MGNFIAIALGAILGLGVTANSASADTQVPCLLHETHLAKIRANDLAWAKSFALEDYNGTKRYKCIDGNRTGASMIHYTIYHQKKDMFVWLVNNTSDDWNTKTRPYPASANDPITSTCELATTVKNNAYGSVEHITKLKAHLLSVYGYQIRDVDGTEEASKRAKLALAESIQALACGGDAPEPPTSCPINGIDESVLEAVSKPWGSGWHQLSFTYDSIHFFGAKGKQVKFHCAPDFGDETHLNSESQCGELILYPTATDDTRVRAKCPIDEIYLDMQAGSSRIIDFRRIFGNHSVSALTACTLYSDAPFGITIR